jgi:hypothetical protein
MGDEPDVTDVDIDDFTAAGGMIFVSKLVIIKNRIEQCMKIPPRDIPTKMSYLMGYGGISLAVVDTLVIRDNFILDNCVNCADPICGIFALAVIALDISRNEISEHLLQHYEDLNSTSVKHGPRGGIWIFMAMGQMDLFSASKYSKLLESKILRNSSGAHAARIHQNVVSVPLGRSLTMTIFGDASVLGNRFTSFGIVPVDIIKLFLALLTTKGSARMSAILQLLSLFAANILIFDLGSFVIYREARRVQAALKKQQFAEAANSGNVESSTGAVSGINRLTGVYSQLADAARLVDMFTMAGMIHFSTTSASSIR